MKDSLSPVESWAAVARITSLSAREQLALQLRYGLVGYRRHTYRELASGLLGGGFCSAERARQIVLDARRKAVQEEKNA